MSNVCATITVQNLTGHEAAIQFSHKNATCGVDTSKIFTLKRKEVSSGTTVNFTTGTTELDYWWVGVQMLSGDFEHQYFATPGTVNSPGTEDMLASSDANKTHQIVVTSPEAGQFQATIKLASGARAASLSRSPFAPNNKIQHVFVLMMENRSFDHMLGYSRLTGTDPTTHKNTSILGLPNPAAEAGVGGVAGTEFSNVYLGITYPVAISEDANPPVDPGHEFTDVLWQLAGERATYTSGGAYPAIRNSGFVYDYVNSPSEDEGNATSNFGKIMECYDTITQLPVLYQLAQEFAVCDNWYSSMPGPTWPNRYFLHGGTSSGLDDSFNKADTVALLGDPLSGFPYQYGSIFDALRAAFGSQGYRIYSGDSFPQVASIKNIHNLDIPGISRFKADMLKTEYPYAYTFIEPNYGKASNATFIGGTSQHPIDGVAAGEDLIKQVYESIRNSNFWNQSMLIVLYDEHGGFYDHVQPPSAEPPGDSKYAHQFSQHGFNFTQYGVRVPAVVISPYIPKATIDHRTYDHTSVLKTLQQAFILNSLTNRDGNADGLMSLISGPARTDAPTTLSAPALPPQAGLASASALTPERAARPIPKGSLPGFLHVAAKTDIELSPPEERDAIVERIKAIQTIGEAYAYIEEVRTKVEAYRAAQK